MTQECKVEDKRIELRVPIMPHSLRGFIEKAIRDDRFFQTLLESPADALANAGLPIKVDSFTGRDYLRLVTVLGNIRSYVKENNLDRTIRFEDLFGISIDVALANEERQKTVGEDRKWDKSEPRRAEEKESKTGVTEDFKKSGVDFGLDRAILIAPLINPAVLAEILVRIDESLEHKMSQFRR
jgi:hypothetical protein